MDKIFERLHKIANKLANANAYIKILQEMFSIEVGDISEMVKCEKLLTETVKNRPADIIPMVKFVSSTYLKPLSRIALELSSLQREPEDIIAQASMNLNSAIALLNKNSYEVIRKQQQSCIWYEDIDIEVLREVPNIPRPHRPPRKL